MENTFKRKFTQWFSFPKRQDILVVFGNVLFAVHTWALYTYLYKVPSFILHQSLGQVLAVLAYMMAFAFVESILVTAVVSLVSSILPGSRERLGFTAKAFLLTAVAGYFSYDLMNSLTTTYPGAGALLERSLAAAGIFLALLAVTYFVKPIHKAITAIADRISVMLYIYAPIGLLSLLVVIIRNLF
jgi:hypothetical protein